jgi:hypothetical protein
MVMVGHSKRLAEPLSPRQKRRLAISLVVVLLAVIGAAVYASVGNGSFGASHDGCVNLTVPSTLGAQIFHECGSAARAWCEQSEVQDDALSRLARPQCVLAGYAPAPSAARSPQG